MDAKDLMIGNWVKNDLGEIQQVVEIHDDEKIMLAYNDFYSADELEPIPLTAEILEKNGFEKLEMYYVWADDGFELWYYPHDSNLRYEFQGKLVAKSPDGMNYVHQLQHFIRLCQIDKTIEL